MTVIERWFIHRTVGIGIVSQHTRPNAVISGRALNEGEGPIEVVRASDHERAVEAEREWCRQIIDVDRRDQGDGRLLATLANMAATRLSEIGEE